MLGTYSGTSRGKAQHRGLIDTELGCWEWGIPYNPGMGKSLRKLCVPQGDHGLENLFEAQKFGWD